MCVIITGTPFFSFLSHTLIIFTNSFSSTVNLKQLQLFSFSYENRVCACILQPLQKSVPALFCVLCTLHSSHFRSMNL